MFTSSWIKELLKFLLPIRPHILRYGYNILHEISKVPFKIPHNISYPYIEWYAFYTKVKFWKLFDLRACEYFKTTPGECQVLSLVLHNMLQPVMSISQTDYDKYSVNNILQ